MNYCPGNDTVAPYKAKATKAFTKEKIRMLKEDFCVVVTEDQEKHLYSLETEVQVENYVLKLIMG